MLDTNRTAAEICGDNTSLFTKRLRSMTTMYRFVREHPELKPSHPVSDFKVHTLGNYTGAVDYALDELMKLAVSSPEKAAEACGWRGRTVSWTINKLKPSMATDVMRDVISYTRNGLASPSTKIRTEAEQAGLALIDFMHGFASSEKKR